jgi:hypothetical protein
MSRTKDPFKRALPPAAKPSTDDDKGTTWHVGPDENDDGLTTALAEFNRLAAEKKTITTRLTAAQELLESFAGERWIEHWAEHNEQPELPVRIVNPETGEYATFVVNDKTATTVVTDKIKTPLSVVLGTDAVKAGLVETIVYSFNQDLLGKTVKNPITGRRQPLQKLLADRIGGLLDSLVTVDELTRPEADSLLTATTVHVFDRDFVASLPGLCNHHVEALDAAVTALGSAIVRYVKPS